MTTFIINLQANEQAWEKDRPTKVVKCQGKCGTCYPERDLEHADMQEGVCAECRNHLTLYTRKERKVHDKG